MTGRFGVKGRPGEQVSNLGKYPNDLFYMNTPAFESSSATATVTADTIAHVKGAWTEIIASNASDSSVIFVRITGVGVSNTDTATLLDIGVGASGSETALIENIAVGGAQGLNLVFPLRLFAGERVSARIQSIVTGGKTASITLRTWSIGESFRAPRTLDVLGSSTANSQGIRLNAGSNNYQQIVASTTKEYSSLICVPSFWLQSNAFGQFGNLFAASGASGFEVDQSQMLITFNSTEQVNNDGFPIFLSGGFVPAGVRLSVKATHANPDRMGACIVGVPVT